MIYEGDGFTVSYKEYGDEENQSVVLFPPGIGFSSKFVSLAEALEKEYHVIIPDMPGVNGTKTKDSDMRTISRDFKVFLEDIGVGQPVLIGYCYGGCIALKLSRIMKVKGLVFMGTGEYFSKPLKALLTVLFAPAHASKIVRTAYAKFFTNFSHFTFEGFTDEQVKIVGERWHQTIWFSFPEGCENDVQTLIITGDKDRICSRDSVEQLQDIYPNNTVKEYPCYHSDYIQELEDRDFDDVKEFLETV